MTSELIDVRRPPSVNPAVKLRRSSAATGEPIGLTHSFFFPSTVLTTGGVAVVDLDGRLEGAFRQTHVGFEFLDGLGHPLGLESEERCGTVGGAALFVGSFVDDQVGLILVAQQRLLADSSRVRVLVDVALAASVDENAADHQLGVAEECDLGGVHVREVGPESLRHLDGLSVVLFDSRTGAPDQRGAYDWIIASL